MILYCTSKPNIILSPVSLRALLPAVVVLLICLLFSSNVHSASLTFAWNPNTELDLAGYKIYYGNTSRNYNVIMDVGNNTTHEVTNLTPGVTYYFAATAYDKDGYESDFSNEVSYTIPVLTTTTSFIPTTTSSVSTTTSIKPTTTTSVLPPTTTTTVLLTTTTTSVRPTTTTTSVLPTTTTTSVLPPTTTTTMLLTTTTTSVRPTTTTTSALPTTTTTSVKASTTTTSQPTTSTTSVISSTTTSVMTTTTAQPTTTTSVVPTTTSSVSTTTIKKGKPTTTIQPTTTTSMSTTTTSVASTTTTSVKPTTTTSVAPTTTSSVSTTTSVKPTTTTSVLPPTTTTSLPTTITSSVIPSTTTSVSTTTTLKPTTTTSVVPATTSSVSTTTIKKATTTTTVALTTTTIPAETTTTIQINIPPVANAGYDRSIQAGDKVLLDGSRSYAADGVTLEYRWKQVSGVEVLLEDDNEAIASFVTENEGSYEFALTVSDGKLESSDTVLIEITEKTIELLSPDNEEQVISRPTLGWDGKGCDSFQIYLSKDGKRFIKVAETAEVSYTVRPLQHFLFSTNKNNPLPIYWKVLGQQAGKKNIWLESPTRQYYHIRKNTVLEKLFPWLFAILNASS